jgi:hypothetical protein
MSLHGSAGTGKTFIVKALINALQSHRKKCLICGTTGIAAVQYPGGTTLHSLFRLGIDEQSRGGFGSDIGRSTPLAEYILAADLIIIDEVSMLTPCIANRVSLTLQSISGYERIQFGGKWILFVGDLLQLPSSVPDFSMPVAYRLITRLLYWSSIRKFQIQQPMRAHDPLSATSLLSMAKGKTNEIQDWRELQRRFHMLVTKDISGAHDFFCDGLGPHNPFPLDRQWICVTNRLVNQINHHLRQWRTQEARSFGIISAVTQLIKLLSNFLGLFEAQQIDFIKKIDTPDLASNYIPILEGNPFVLIRNTHIRSGLVKGKRCREIQIKNRTVFFSVRGW